MEPENFEPNSSSPVEVTFAVDSMSVSENSGKSIKYTFTRAEDDTTNPLTIDFTVAGEATFDTD